MFTGLIEATGFLAQIEGGGESTRLWFKSSTLDFSDVAIGASIAVNGVCLTVIRLKADRFAADVSGETLTRSGLGRYRSGQRVNLEKALLPTTRLGGHLVSGHVDGVGEVESVEPDGNTWQLRLRPPQVLNKYIAEKGSICIDGCSLTVNQCNEQGFRLTIVPHSRDVTIIADYVPGTLVNIEVDLIARYTEQLLLGWQSVSEPGLTREKLRECGFK